jgi:hypothetical protein
MILPFGNGKSAAQQRRRSRYFPSRARQKHQGSSRKKNQPCGTQGRQRHDQRHDTEKLRALMPALCKRRPLIKRLDCRLDL